MKESIKKNIKENKSFYFVIWATIIAQAIRYFPFKFGGWNQIMLSFSYRYGFIQRAFLGTILDVISTVFHIPWGYMRYIYGVFTVVFYSALYLYVIYKMLENEKNSDIRFFLKGLTIAFFMGPGWVANYSNFALTDVWIQICSILAVYLLVKDKNKWLAIIICCIGVLIYPGYIFTYWNIVVAYLFYKTFIVLKKGIDKKWFILFSVNIICVGALCGYTLLGAQVKQGITIDYVMERTAEFVDKSVEEVANHKGTIYSLIFKNTVVEVDTEDILAEDEITAIESSISSAEGAMSTWHLYIQEYGLLLVAMAFLFFPFFYEIYKYWKLVVITARMNGLQKSWLYGLLPFGSLTILPCYIVLNDYGRYTNAAFIYEFIIIWLLNRIQDENIIQATKEYVKQVKANKYYYVFLLCYAAINGTFHQNLINELVSTVETYLWKVVALF